MAFECYYENPTSKDKEQYRRTDGADICIIGKDGRNLIRLIKDPGADRYPVWSPDSSQIAYVRENGIYLINADGTNRRWMVKGTNLYPIWSPDGKHILFSTHRDIYLVAVADRRVTNLTSDLDTNAHSPNWILPGQKIVFLSGHSDGFYQHLRIMNPDGSDKQALKEKLYYCGSISVSNSGQVAFIERSSSTFSCGDGYITELDEWQPVQHFKASGRILTWSSTGRYLAYDGVTGLEVLDAKTGKLQSGKSPDFKSPDEYLSWSPDDQLVAITLRDIRLVEKWAFNIHYGLIEAWPEDTHIYIFDVQRNTLRLLI